MTMSSAGTTLTMQGEPRPATARCRPEVRRVQRQDRRHDDGGRAGRGQPDEVALVGERVDGDVEPGQPERRAGQPEERGQPRRGSASRRAPRCARGSAGARPKEMRSASESSWRPNGEVAPMSRRDEAVGDVEHDRDGDERGGDA